MMVMMATLPNMMLLAFFSISLVAYLKFFTATLFHALTHLLYFDFCRNN